MDRIDEIRTVILRYGGRLRHDTAGIILDDGKDYQSKKKHPDPPTGGVTIQLPHQGRSMSRHRMGTMTRDITVVSIVGFGAYRSP